MTEFEQALRRAVPGSGNEVLQRVLRGGDKPTNRSTWRELCDRVADLRTLHSQILRTKESDLTDAHVEALGLIDEAIIGCTREQDLRSERGDRGPRNLRSGREGTGERSNAKGPRWRDARTGQEVRVYAPGESLARDLEAQHRDELPGPRILTVGDLVARHITGRWASDDHAAEARAMSVGSLADGGYAVPTLYASEFIDKARAQSVVFRAGAMTLGMDGSTLDLARIAEDPTFAWKEENAESSGSTISLERLRFTARTVMAYIVLSEELAQDSPNIGEIINAALAGAFAVEVDRVALAGDNSPSPSAPEPVGVFNTSGILEYDNTGSAPSYAMVSHAIEKCWLVNEEPNAAVFHPDTLGALNRLTDTTGQPIQPPPYFTELARFRHTSVPSNLGSPVTCKAVVGDFAKMMVALRLGGLQIDASRQAATSTDNAFSQYQLHIRAVMRMDVQLARPAAFCAITNIQQ